jgi:hypothetical protein
MNDLRKYAEVFDCITPWSGVVPSGYVVDFLGNVSPKEFLEPWGHHADYVDGAELRQMLPKPWEQALGGGLLVRGSQLARGRA